MPAQLQAGSAYWPITTPKKDDGVSANRVGYEFSWDGNAARKLMNGELPEMHAWVAIADPPREIIDITAPFFKLRAIEFGYKYEAPEPPEFFWIGEDEPLPWGVQYTPNETATKLAYDLLDSIMHGKPMILSIYRKGMTT